MLARLIPTVLAISATDRSSAFSRNTSEVLARAVGARVQEILGHSQITHTMDTYSHVTPNMQRAAFGRLGERLQRS